MVLAGDGFRQEGEGSPSKVVSGYKTSSRSFQRRRWGYQSLSRLFSCLLDLRLMDSLALFTPATRVSDPLETEFYPNIFTMEASDSDAVLIIIAAHSVSKYPERISVEYFSGQWAWSATPVYGEYSDQPRHNTPFYKKGFLCFKMIAPTGDVTVKLWTQNEPILFEHPVIAR